MMSEIIERLRQFVVPPPLPLYHTGDWCEIERALGIRLPEDYKTLIETFGQGTFVGKANRSGLLISSYLGPAEAVELGEGFGAYFRTLMPMAYGIYPDQPGLLGFGSYADKDTIAWNTSGEPKDWEIVYDDPETGLHKIKDMGMLEFVISVLEESSPLHKSGVIRMGNMEGPHTFRPEP